MLSFIDKLSNTKRTLIIAGLLLAGIANLGITAARIHHSGTEVILATLPVDPRSLFQGDYVVLNYSISRLDATQMEGSPSPLRNLADSAGIAVGDTPSSIRGSRSLSARLRSIQARAGRCTSIVSPPRAA